MPTFGKTDIGAFSFSPIAGEKRVYLAELSEPGYVTKLSIYDETSGAWHNATLTESVYLDARPRIYVGFHYGGSGKFRLIVFDDTADAPGAQLIVSPEITIATPSLRYSDPGGSNQWVDADTYSDGTEDPFGVSGASPQIISVYATYDPVPAASLTAPVLLCGPQPDPGWRYEKISGGMVELGVEYEEW